MEKLRKIIREELDSVYLGEIDVAASEIRKLVTKAYKRNSRKLVDDIEQYAKRILYQTKHLKNKIF